MIGVGFEAFLFILGVEGHFFKQVSSRYLFYCIVPYSKAYYFLYILRVLACTEYSSVIRAGIDTMIDPRKNGTDSWALLVD